jgi:thiol-disulfide isomerase/thioredoxin
MDKRKFLKAAVAGSMLLGLGPVHSQQSKKTTLQKMSLAGLDEVSGKPIKLDNLGGKVYLVSFFTAGCTLCNKDLKLLREFYAANKSKGLILLGVNMDASKKDFDDYRRLVGLSVPKDQYFPMVWKNAADYSDNFGPVPKAPTHFVLDKNLALIFKREGAFGPDDWDNVWSSLN